MFVRTLRNLDAILDKAAAHAAARKIEAQVLVDSRLFPDMYPLTPQVQIACDHAKGAAARLTGNEVPKYEDSEKTLDDLKARIAKTIEYIETLKPEQFEGADTRKVTLKVRGEERSFDGVTYLGRIALPNFFFHVTTAYNILRHNGVEIGKRDYIGPL
jgi:hypothetical protein